MSMSIEEVQALPAAVPVKETSEALGICRDSAYAAIHKGDIPAVRVGRQLLVPKTAILEMLGIAQ